MTTKIQRLFASVLVPFLVLGNSVAHSHRTDAHTTSGSGRSHIHVGSGSHDGHHHHGAHEHSHEKCGHHAHDETGHEQQHGNPGSNDSETTPNAPENHDSDAIYLAAVDYWLATTEFRLPEFGLVAMVVSSNGRLPNVQSPFRHSLWRHPATSDPPLFLLHAALRL